MNGSVYKQGSIVVLHMDKTLLSFGIVEDILVLLTDVYYLVCSVLVTEYFSHHFLKLTNSFPKSMSFANLVHFMILMSWLHILFHIQQ